MTFFGVAGGPLEEEEYVLESLWELEEVHRVSESSLSSLSISLLLCAWAALNTLTDSGMIEISGSAERKTCGRVGEEYGGGYREREEID